MGKDTHPPFDSGTAPTDTELDDTGTPPIPEEVCNGLDDDGDGEVDEGYADLNANGVPECLEGCDWLAPVPARGVTRAEECGPNVDIVEDPWNVEIAWQLTLEDEETGEDLRADTLPLVVTGPSATEPGIYVHAWSTAFDLDEAAAIWVEPDGGEQDRTIGLEQSSTAVAGDVDADGTADIFRRWSGERLERVTPDGTTIWNATTYADQEWVRPILADLDGDGTPELVDQEWVFDAITGAFLFELEGRYHLQGTFHPLAADLDGDGRAELVIQDQVSTAAGTPLWRAVLAEASAKHVLPVQADADPDGELLFVGTDLAMYDPDGAELWRVIEGASWPGPPCAGDLDGDGQMEVAVPWSMSLAAYDPTDGALLWRIPTSDSSGSAGCSVADLDGDGAAEVLYADEVSFGIYNGRDGAALYRDDTHSSETGYEFPVTVDLDEDGHTEIIVAAGHLRGDRVPLLTVYRHAGSGWTPGGTTWWAHDDSMANYNEDGTIPARPEPAWIRYGLWRGRLASRDSWPLGNNLRVTVEGACVADCAADPLTLAIHVENAGAFDVPAGLPYAVYALHDDGPRLVTIGALPALPVGTSSGSLLLTLPADASGPLGLRVVLDDDGTGTGNLPECHEDDNTADWVGDPCPG